MGILGVCVVVLSTSSFRRLLCVSESGTGVLLTDAEFDAWEKLLISSGVRMRGTHPVQCLDDFVLPGAEDGS
jgi:hypothetical protein